MAALVRPHPSTGRRKSGLWLNIEEDDFGWSMVEGSLYI